mgnify:CR=1 FL=1
MPPLIDREKCTGCGTCAEICNSNLFVFDRSVDKFPRIKFPEECWHCDSCVLDCPRRGYFLRIPLSYGLMHVDASTLTPRRPSHDPRQAVIEADLLIVGGGIGGLMAGIAAGKAGCKNVVIMEKCHARRSGSGATGNDHFNCYSSLPITATTSSPYSRKPCT